MDCSDGITRKAMGTKDASDGHSFESAIAALSSFNCVIGFDFKSGLFCNAVDVIVFQVHCVLVDVEDGVSIGKEVLNIRLVLRAIAFKLSGICTE